MELNKEFFSKIITIASGIALLAFVIGSFVINTSLNKFQLIDFDLLKPRAISVGLLLLFIVCLIVVAYIFLIDITDARNNNEIIVMGMTAIKMEIFTITLFTFIDVEDTFNPAYHLWGINWILAYHFGSILLTVIFIGFNKGLSLKAHNRLKYICLIILFVLITITTLRYINNDIFQDVLIFNSVVFGFAYLISFRFIFKADPVEESNTHTKLYGPGKIRSAIPLYIIVVTCFTYVVGGLVSLYAGTIYPHVQQSYGGGKLEKMYYVSSNDTISGMKIYETSKDVYLMEKDSNVLKLNWDKIDKIIKSNKLKK